ncbi:MAG: GNAT family N-acetyltransferase [Spirochaetes bacterium]|nr:GNAT family N-acetyltransferase [Spirochaetota bacterium]
MEKFCEIIKPGSRIFISGGPATPVHSIKYIYSTPHLNFQDLEIIQLATPTDFEFFNREKQSKFRFKTFSIGEKINMATQFGLLDIIPTTIAELPYLFLSGAVEIDVAIIQTSLPDNHGNLNLGTVNDINRIAIQKASIAIAEVNPNVPVTLGDTGIFLEQFDYVIESDEPLLEYLTPPFDETLNKIGEYISNLIEDGSTVSLSMGRLFDAVASHLHNKKGLKVWSHIVSDWIISLIESGAIINPEFSKREAPVVATSCIGTKKLYSYINNNHHIALLPLFNTTYQQAMQNLKKLVSVLNVNKIDITGDSVILSSKDLQLTGFDSKMNFALAATHSRDGKVIVGLRSQDQNGESNIVINHSISSIRHRCSLGTVRYVATEYGIANIFGKPIRERVLTMLEIAHPDHRQKLFDEAKANGLVFSDQIYIIENTFKYPYSLEKTASFKNDLPVKFRPIKPSDEDKMRRLFYQFSDEAKYLRYFSAIRTMSHKEMQRYVNVDYEQDLSIVGIIQERGTERIIAECRYSYYKNENIYETAFIVDEEFQGIGIATFMLDYLLLIAKERGLERLSAYVLARNDKMISIFEKSRISPRVIDDGDKLRYDFYL